MCLILFCIFFRIHHFKNHLSLFQMQKLLGILSLHILSTLLHPSVVPMDSLSSPNGKKYAYRAIPIAKGKNYQPVQKIGTHFFGLFLFLFSWEVVLLLLLFGVCMCFGVHLPPSMPPGGEIGNGVSQGLVMRWCYPLWWRG